MVPGRLLLCLQRADLDGSSHTLLHHHAYCLAERSERLSTVTSASNTRSTVYSHTVGATPMTWSKAPVSARPMGSPANTTRRNTLLTRPCSSSGIKVKR